MSYTNPDAIDLDLLDQLDAAFAGGGTVAAFTATSEPGTVVSGPITGLTMRQSRDFTTGDPAVWPDGKPKQEVVITIASDQGERAVYIQTWGRAKLALTAAVTASGLQKVSSALGQGNTLTVTFNGKKDAINARGKEFQFRDYTYSITPASVPSPALTPPTLSS